MSARSLNRVTLIGNLTRDPNLRYTPSGASVCSFGLATNRSWTPADGGEKQEKAEFHNIVSWGKLADICGQLLHSGDKAYVEGRIQTRDWKTDDGQDRRITEIVIENMILLNSRSNRSGSYSAPNHNDGDAPAKPTRAAKPKKEAPVKKEEVTEAEDVSDEIPF